VLGADVAEAGDHALAHPGWTERHPHRQLGLSGIRQGDFAGRQGGILLLDGHLCPGQLLAQVEDFAFLSHGLRLQADALVHERLG